MTSLLPSRPGLDARAVLRSAGEVAADLRHRRPLPLVALAGGVAAAGATLLIAMAVGVAGWYLSDAGAHGTPGDGLRIGALVWLLGHGSGVTVAGAALTAVPLGVTLLCAVSVWRFGLRVGDSVAGHGPDADRLADGERDLTVQAATALYAVGYLAVALIARHLVAARGTTASGLLFWSLLLTVGVGGTGIAVGSGRAATWAALLPQQVRDVVAGTCRLLVAWALVSTAVLVVALLVHGATAVNLLDELHAGAGSDFLYVALSLLVVPNAAVFSSAYLAGPGFAVGAGTLVSPAAVHLGPLPVLPLLAALPHGAPGWAQLLVGLAPVTAVAAVVLTQRQRPTLEWRVGMLRGLVTGLLAAVAVAIVSGLAGGAVGPGRMGHVAPHTAAVLVHLAFWLGLGGFLGGAIATFRQRQASDAAA